MESCYVINMTDGNKMQNTGPLAGLWMVVKKGNCAVWIKQVAREHVNTYKGRFA